MNRNACKTNAIGAVEAGAEDAVDAMDNVHHRHKGALHLTQLQNKARIYLD